MNRNDVSVTTQMKTMSKAIECIGEHYRVTCSNLTKAGFSQLGSGHYGSAWAHKECEGWAFKLSGQDDGDSFPAYVYWCMANPMPHIPEYKYPTFSEDRTQFIVMMPKYVGCCNELLSCGEHFSAYSAMCDVLSGADSQRPGEFYEIGCAAREIRRFFSGRVSFDMHEDNVMVDPLTNKLIITDPIHQGDTYSMIEQITGVSVRPKFQPMVQMDMFAPSLLQGSSGDKLNEFLLNWREFVIANAAQNVGNDFIQVNGQQL